MNIRHHLILYSTIIVLLVSISPSAYAYLDPGTGSALLQGLLAGMAGVLAIIKLYWQRLKSFFSRKNRHTKPVDNKKHE